MFLRGIGRGSHGLKVVAVLLSAFGLSPKEGLGALLDGCSPIGAHLEVERRGLGEEGFWRRNSASRRRQAGTQLSRLMRAW